MSRLKRVIHEVHRRSLWQVLGIYLGSSWLVFQVVSQVTEAVGLPDWVPPFALLLPVLGLPMVLATAFVQEGSAPAPHSGTEPSAQRLQPRVAAARRRLESLAAEPRERPPAPK